MNSMGAHFNPVSFSIVNSQSKEGLKNSYMATCAGLYTMYNSAVLCANDQCGFCTQLIEQVSKLIIIATPRMRTKDLSGSDIC